jgi:hypothetical protein
MAPDAELLAELAELRERARRYVSTLTPIPLPDEPGETDADVDLDGQCLRYAAAHSLRVPPDSLPEVPGSADRWEAWTAAMLKLGYQVEDLPLDEIPPADGRPWIAVVDSGAHTHALGCVGTTVLNAAGYHEPHSSISPAAVRAAFRFVEVA